MDNSKPISDYRQSLKERILKRAMEMFVKNGIKAVKMDDIASALGISKRTLYEVYINKEVLLFEGVKRHHENQMSALREVAANALNVMDIVLFIYRQKNLEFKDTSPHFMEDVHKYPRITEFLESERIKYREVYIEFMERGVKEGFFRRDVNYKLISHLFEAIGSQTRTNRLYQHYSSNELFDSLLLVTLRGFCTPKGVAMLDHFKENEKTQ